MLEIIVPASEQYDPVKNEFVYTKAQKLVMEHSLLSLSKWEEKWQKPFLTNDPKTQEESLDYYRCMTITQNVDPNVYLALTEENVAEINRYIEDKHTATWFSHNGPPSREIVTSELIYYSMFANGVDKSCEKWHLNRLMTLLRVFGEKNKDPKKMSKSEILSRNRALNKARRQRLKTRG